MPTHSPQRFALDIRQLCGGPSGDRTHLLGLLREFPSLAPEDDFLLCLNRQPLYDPAEVPAGPNLHLRVVPCRPGWLWTPVAWPWMLRREHVAVAHGVYLVPPLAPCPTVVTIHDVSFMAHPEWFPRRELRLMRRLIPLSARRATRLVTGSVHAAEEIARHLHVPREKIAVIPYGLRPAAASVDRDEARAQVVARYGLKERYVLAVGLLQPRKNLLRLLEAFARLAPARPDVQLAVVGATGWGNEPFHARLGELALGDRVVLCGRVPDADLWLLYRAAARLAYPSLYEGFGLPPLEAMACGTPVVASNTTAIPEVVGEAGLLCDPLDVAALAEALAAVLDDAALAARLSEAGPARAAQFTWAQAAAAYLQLFRELGGQTARQ